MFDRLTGVRSTKRDSVWARASSRVRRRLPLDLRRPDCLASDDDDYIPRVDGGFAGTYQKRSYLN